MIIRKFHNFLIFMSIIILSSCEDKLYTIGGYFSNKISEEPISGLEIGLYKGLLTPDATHEDFILLNSTITDSLGRFAFEIGENDNNSLYYFPIPTQDTNSINSKYVVSFTNWDIVDWSKEKIWTLIPSTNVKLYIGQIGISDSIIIKYQNQISVGLDENGQIRYSLSLISGETHSLDVYSTHGVEEKYIKSIDIYVKSVIIEEDRIEMIQPVTTEIRLNGL